MHVTRTTLAGLAGCLVSLVCHAYGPRGHEMIGAIADAQLNPAAKTAVQKNLGFPLSVAATWADCVKDVEKQGSTFVYKPDPHFAAACKAFATTAGKKRMIDYARRNWSNCHDEAATKGCHALYHFADVAIEQDAYDRSLTGTSDHDIVSAIEAAMAKLEGKPVPAPFSIKDNAEAMLMLAHLVGDLHQPLHVGAVYLDAQDHPKDPGPATTPHDPGMDTRGGNKLEFGSGNLHADWDDVLASFDPLHPSTEMLGLAASVPASEGAIDKWPEAWANETIRAARDAYADLSFTHSGAKKTGDWVTSFPDRADYVKRRNAEQKKEMATAGARLAQILNAVSKAQP
ncbi:MAG TPA: S1/P1 nuclease [Variovorax sp.]|nr:S1/P1 nuclease [Variovorax sp.]